MLRESDSESDIVLGNKQIAGIFLVIAVLLGVAFTGGYMVGSRQSANKKAVASGADTAEATSSAAARSGDRASASSPIPAGQTHTLGTDEQTAPVADDNPVQTKAPLGARKTKQLSEPAAQTERAKVAPPPEPESAATATYTPRPGTRYLQVVAVSRDEAEAVADVLHKKGFRAHAVPKPGNGKIYRVIVGPIRDAGDLSSTRDALRKTGFREVIVQNY